VSDPAYDCAYPVIKWNGKSWVIAYEAVKEGENQVIQILTK
jgi:hypothetical protein